MTISVGDAGGERHADLRAGPSPTTPASGASRGPDRTCVVAVDGSPGSVRALVWGLREAVGGRWRVEVLTIWPEHRSVLIHEVPGHFAAARWSARAAQSEAVRQAMTEVPDGTIACARLENADATAAIVHASSGCDLVVLGSDPGDSSHSLTNQVLDQAACDVVVVGRTVAHS